MRLRRSSSAGVIRFAAFGVTVEVGYNAADLEPLVRALLPPGWTSPQSADSAPSFQLLHEASGDYTVMRGGHTLLERAALEVAVGRLDSEIRRLIATSARDLVSLYAGAVAVGERALLIPGKSFTGKTTLVRALVQAGATHCSDEYALLDQSGKVLPYPRGLSTRASAAAPAAQTELGEPYGVTGMLPVEVAAVVITRYRPGARWAPQPVSRGAGVLALIENTVPAQAPPPQKLQVITQALSGARVLVGDRGEADDTARALIQAMAP